MKKYFKNLNFYFAWKFKNVGISRFKSDFDWCTPFLKIKPSLFSH